MATAESKGCFAMVQRDGGTRATTQRLLRGPAEPVGQSVSLRTDAAGSNEAVARYPRGWPNHRLIARREPRSPDRTSAVSLTPPLPIGDVSTFTRGNAIEIPQALGRHNLWY